MSSVSAVNTLLSDTTPAISLSNILASVAGATTPGIDVTAAVAAGIYADRAPERIWQADIVTLSSQTTALTAIQTATSALVTDMQSLNTMTGPLAARTVTSSNPNGVTATAATGTVAGVHTVVVSKLASTGAWYSDLKSGSTGATDNLLPSSFTITDASGYSATFQTGGVGTAGDSLTDLAATINANKDLGVTASVVSDSTGSRLAIISKTSGSANDFSVTTPYTGMSWTSPVMPKGDTLGVNSITLTSSAGTATINTTSGQTYADLVLAINGAMVTNPPTSYSSTQASLTATTPLTAGSLTSIQDNAGNTFQYRAVAGDTVATLNAAIAGAVTDGTLSANVTVAITGGKEVISEGSTDQGIKVMTTDSVLGAMNAAPGIQTTTPLGLTASTIPDGSGGTSLVITGTANFTINEPSINTPSFGFTQAVQGANAALTVDGVPISSASNNVAGAITGVTFSLLGASPGVPVSLTVASDASQASTAINQFVTDYNSALGLVNSQFTVTGSSATQGVLGSDPILRDLQGALLQALNFVNKPATGSTTVTTLSDLGINAGTDGALTVNSTTLNNALINNASDVQNFFEGASLNGFAASVTKGLAHFTNAANGAFTVDLSGIRTTSASLTKQISDLETNYIASQQTILTAMYSKAEIALQQLPTQMAQLDAMLGTNTKSGG